MILSGDIEYATRRWTKNADIGATGMTWRYRLQDHPAISRYQKREHRLRGEARPNRSKCSCHHDNRTWNIERARGDISQQFHIRATIRSLAYRTRAVSCVPPEGASHLWRDSVTDAHSNLSALRNSPFESIRSDPRDQVRLSYISPRWRKSQRKPGDLEVRTKKFTHVHFSQTALGSCGDKCVIGVLLVSIPSVRSLHAKTTRTSLFDQKIENKFKDYEFDLEIEK